MSGLGLLFGVLLGAVLLYSLWHARRQRRLAGPEEVMDGLDPREREAIARELQAGRSLNALARLRRAAPGLGPETAKAVIERMQQEQ